MNAEVAPLANTDIEGRARSIAAGRGEVLEALAS